jgi:imidazolonepropionase-like amidohydrolase
MYNEPIHYMMGDVIKDEPINTRGITSIVDSVKKYKKAVSPTLVAFASIISAAKLDSTDFKLSAHKSYERIAKEWNWDFRSNPYSRKFVSSTSKHRLQTGYAFQNALVKAFNAKGVLLLAGTDAPTIPGLIPGHSLHRELQKMVDAGLSNFEALRSATVNAAAFLGMSNKFGTIEVNKEGSFILLNQNPLLSITNTLSIANVILKGNILFGF